MEVHHKPGLVRRYRLLAVGLVLTVLGVMLPRLIMSSEPAGDATAIVAEQVLTENQFRDQEVRDKVWRWQTSRDLWRRMAVTVKPKPKPKPKPSAAPRQEPSAKPSPKPSPKPKPSPTHKAVLAQNVTAYQRWALTQVGPAEFYYLNRLWTRESGWNRYAHNPSSGAHGIPQALPGSKMAEFGSDWEWNGYTQMKWGLNYIKERYGTCRAAWAHSQANGWY